jgi:hypothetical protein
VRSLPPRLCVSLLCVVAVSACGEDSEKRYAGLEVAQVKLEDGPGYRLRYLKPPWEGVADDPLVTGKQLEVPFGESSRCDRADAACLAVEPKSSAVLEIDRASVSNSPDVITYPKYRLEASVVRCAEGTLPSQDLCADHLAREDGAGRKAAGTDEVYSTEDGENDFGQHYRELLGRNVDSRRYRRIVYFATDDREVSVRVFLEANPSLAEDEVTRMVHAFEVLPADEEP